MADYDINSPNDYVPSPETVPKSAIGSMGGLGALGYMANHGPAAKQPMMAGGLATADGQQQLEDTLFSRIRSNDDIQSGKDSRRGALEQIQQAMSQQVTDTDPLTNIMSGIVHTDQPWDVSNGFRDGVARAFDAKQAARKENKDSAVSSSTLALKFLQGENENDQGEEEKAMSNLQKLAKPVRVGTLGGAGGTGSKRPMWVPGTGLVDITTIDPTTGKFAVVYPDNKMTSEIHKKAVTLATAETESAQNNMDFKDTAEREDYVRNRAAQLAMSMMPDGAGQTSGSASAAPAAGSKLPGKGEIPDDILDGVRKTESGKTDGYVINPKTKAMGPYQFLPETVAMLHKQGLKFNPMDEAESRNAANIYLTQLKNQNGGDLNKALAAYGGHVTADPSKYIASVTGGAAAAPAAAAGPAVKPIYGPEEQKTRTATAEEQTKLQGAQYKQAFEDSNNSIKTLQTIKDLKEIPFDPGMFAKWKQKGGSLMDALGSNGPLAKQAANSTAAEGLLQNLTNARMLLEHGTQTADDEARFKKEFANISNPRDAYAYMLKHMQELAVKAQDRYTTMDSTLKKNGGKTYDGTSEAWADRASGYGPLVRKYGGSYMGRSEFIDNVVNNPNNLKAAGGDAAKLRAKAEQEWNKLGSK